jgi:hypothetical protein
MNNQKDVSINTLVSQIIKQHIDWHSNASKTGFISVRIISISSQDDGSDIRARYNFNNRISSKEGIKEFILLLRKLIQYRISTRSY